MVLLISSICSYLVRPGLGVHDHDYTIFDRVNRIDGPLKLSM